jgi:hypothetical protein
MDCIGLLRVCSPLLLSFCPHPRAPGELNADASAGAVRMHRLHERYRPCGSDVSDTASGPVHCGKPTTTAAAGAAPTGSPPMDVTSDPLLLQRFTGALRSAVARLPPGVLDKVGKPKGQDPHMEGGSEGKILFDPAQISLPIMSPSPGAVGQAPGPRARGRQPAARCLEGGPGVIAAAVRADGGRRLRHHRRLRV